MTPLASSSTSRGVTRELDTHADLDPVVDLARTDSVVASPVSIDVCSLVEPEGLWTIVCHDAPWSVVRASWNVVVPTGARSSAQEMLNGTLPEVPTVRRATVTLIRPISGRVGSIATGAVVLDRACPKRSVAVITQR